LVFQDLQPRSFTFLIFKLIKFNMSVIQVKNLTKSYKVAGKMVEVLHNLNFDLQEGEMVAIMGKSGSGKSTLLNILGTLDKPTSGEVLYNLTNPFGLKDKELSKFRGQTVGFVFQQFYLQPFLTVRDNVATPLFFQNLDKIEIQNRVDKALQDVDLLEKIDYLPSQLSGGQMHRVAIARSLVSNPKIILADEPTGNLDEKTGEDILAVLGKLAKKTKTSMVIVTHDKDVASKCDRTLHLVDGSLNLK
jgi:ABC-type lipoprotein export system ATPase subunit